jgi:NAD(P)-dependent dehydrogenase (short-subunit alcohol dehydrogenase family)
MMTRPLGEQVVVITGASSGIGRATAVLLGERGASVVLAARGQEALDATAREVERAGGRALPVVTDVAEWPQVEALARAAVEKFGRIDTWVNNAAISAYATVEQMEIGEVQRVVQVNLMGQVHGMKAALAQIRAQGQGTIINVASALAERAVPLQAAYCASKHAIKGFTEALRLELESDGVPIDVVLVEPSSINTPLFTHARSKVGVKPMPIPPVYEPRVVAEAIAELAERPRRQVVVGGAGKALVTAQRLSPALLDRYMTWRRQMITQQLTDQRDDGVDNFDRPLPGAGSAEGDFGEKSKSTSLYTRYLEMSPNRKRVAILLAALGLGAAVRKLAD